MYGQGLRAKLLFSPKALKQSVLYLNPRYIYIDEQYLQLDVDDREVLLPIPTYVALIGRYNNSFESRAREAPRYVHVSLQRLSACIRRLIRLEDIQSLRPSLKEMLS